MRKEMAAPTAQHDKGEHDKGVQEHHLVAELREAMARKDIVTMGRMLELLGSIKAELVAGGPVIDRIPAAKSDPTAGAAPSSAQVFAKRTPPRTSLLARLSRH